MPSSEIGAGPITEGAGGPDDEFVAPSEASSTPVDGLVIWGTDVSVTTCKTKFKKFLQSFVDPDAEDDERTAAGFDPTSPIYMQKLEQIADLETPYLDVNSTHVKMFDEDLYRQLICYPQEVIPTLDMAVNEMFWL